MTNSIVPKSGNMSLTRLHPEIWPLINLRIQLKNMREKYKLKNEDMSDQQHWLGRIEAGAKVEVLNEIIQLIKVDLNQRYGAIKYD